MFSSVLLRTAINENSGSGQVIYTVDTDDESDISAGVTYSLKADNNDDAAAFSINSSTGDPALFVFNLQTGALLTHIVAKADTDNGLSSPRGWDLDGDGLIDYVYAGDLKGNVWKFDLSDNSTGNWGLHAEGDPFFVATDAGGNRQPITGGLSVSMDPATFKPWVFFGTGKYLESSDLSSTGVQSLYGIKDNDAAVGARATDLQARTMAVTSGTIDGKPVRAFEANDPLDTDKKGWFVDLTVLPPAERMVGDPFLLGNVLVAASIIPSSDPCDAGGTGYINALDAYTGTSVQSAFFDVDGDGEGQVGERPRPHDQRPLPQRLAVRRQLPGMMGLGYVAYLDPQSLTQLQLQRRAAGARGRRPPPNRPGAGAAPSA